MLAARARKRPGAVAIIADDGVFTRADLDGLADRAAAAFQRDGLRPGDRVAFCAGNSGLYAAVMLGALKAGLALCPLATGWPAEAVGRMLDDCDAAVLFADEMGACSLPPGGRRLVRLAGQGGGPPLDAWLAPEGARPTPTSIDPHAAFNIAYSSGTTARPKGIVQSQILRWRQTRLVSSWGPEAVVMAATPFWANATLSGPSFPALAQGLTLVIMGKFDAGRFLELVQRHRVTHTVLVPVQLQQILAHPGFEQADISSLLSTLITGAPFSEPLKRQAIARWPGSVREIYTLSEGGAGTSLDLSSRSDKLHTVGRPNPGVEIRLIDDRGGEVPVGAVGEIVGRSPFMMTGYHNAPSQTAAAEWRDDAGRPYIRTGDLGRFDEEGFLAIMGRKKDMIISGGVNVYPSDIEQVMAANPEVAEAAVVGAPSLRWGETPVAFVVPSTGAAASPDPDLLRIRLLDWTNARVAKTQRLMGLRLVDDLPRNALGKVLKRDLRQQCASFAGSAREPERPALPL